LLAAEGGVGRTIRNRRCRQPDFRQTSFRMRVIYTDKALENLDGILAYIASNYATVYDAFQSRLQSVIKRISEWPDSAQRV